MEKNQVELLEKPNAVLEIKKSMDGLNRLDIIEEETNELTKRPELDYMEYSKELRKDSNYDKGLKDRY